MSIPLLVLSIQEIFDLFHLFLIVIEWCHNYKMVSIQLNITWMFVFIILLVNHFLNTNFYFYKNSIFSEYKFYDVIFNTIRKLDLLRLFFFIKRTFTIRKPLSFEIVENWKCFHCWLFLLVDGVIIYRTILLKNQRTRLFIEFSNTAKKYKI